MNLARWCAALAVTAAAAQEPPEPFQNLEDVLAPESQAFFSAEGARARAALDALPQRPALLERIRALSDAAPLVTDVKAGGKRVFYLKLASPRSAPVLCVREGLAGAERVLVEPRGTIEWHAPAPDGRHVAYGVSEGEDVLLRVFAVDANRDLPFVIDRARFNAGLAWHPDGRSFYYARVPDASRGEQRHAHIRLYRHALGGDPSKDEIVFAPGVGGARDVPEFDYPSLHVPLESRYAYAIAREGVRREIAVHVTELADLARGRPQWRKIVGFDDGVTAIEGWKDDLLLLTYKGAPNMHVVRMKPTASFTTARPVVPEGDAVIQEMALARDAIYLRTTVGGVDRLEKVPLGLFASRTRQFVKLPFDNAISQLVADPRAPGVLVRLQGWVEPPAIVLVDTKGELRRTDLQPAPAIDLSGLDEVRLYTKSADGTSIPVTLIYRKATTLNGRNPTLLVAYGSYGVTLSPRFDPGLIAWLERGGVYAIAHVRGGGEFGLAWHMAGMRAQKANTILDFIAAAQFLAAYGFTSPARLAAMGEGAGAIPVAGAMVRRPELFGAVVLRSPITDLVRLEFTPNGPANIPEFGSSTTREGAALLRAVSPLQQVKDGAIYPPVLITAAPDEPSLSLSQPARLAARLQAATPVGPIGRPVLMRVGRERHDEDLADIFSFALWALDEK